MGAASMIFILSRYGALGSDIIELFLSSPMELASVRVTLHNE